MIAFFRKPQPAQENPHFFHAMKAFSDALEDKLLEGNVKLPVLPDVATQVLWLAGSQNVQLDELSSLIHQDQALAGYVLRMSNSALLSGSQSVDSLTEGIARLGTKLVGELAAIASVRAEVFRCSVFKEDLENVWRHALVSGLYAKQIAFHLSLNAEKHFMCGLLHSIGKPILYQMIAESGYMDKISNNRYFLFSNLVKRLHPVAGKLAAAHWNLPYPVQVCCAYYLSRKETTDHRKEVNVTYLSTRLANWSLSDASTDYMSEAVKRDSVVEELQLDASFMKHLMGENRNLLQIADSFRMA